MTDSMLQAALAAGARGWSVVPLRPGGKVPLIPWQELQQRRADAGEIRRWFRRWPDANVGVVTGAISQLAVLDVDPRHGGEQSLGALQREHEPLPVTVTVQTGGGGHHLYFAHPGDVVPNRVAMRAGLDIRGDGGCVAMPPSLHPSGRRYRWTRGHSPDDIAPAAMPNWLRVVAARRDDQAHAVEYWRELLRSGVSEGARNNTVASLTGHLLWHGVDPAVVMELMVCFNRARCRPPLADREVAQTVASITRLHERGEAADGPAG